MLSSRIAAVFCTLFLIGFVALACIALVNFAGPILAHGTQVEHMAGKLQPGKGPQEVVLVTNGKQVHFQCQQRCLKQIAHIQRHINEKASTDVYFLRGPNNTLIAIDVD